MQHNDNTLDFDNTNNIPEHNIPPSLIPNQKMIDSFIQNSKDLDLWD